jgi:hypothetical protein
MPENGTQGWEESFRAFTIHLRVGISERFMYPHRIRLRGPWQFKALARFEQFNGRLAESKQDLPAPGRMTMPCRWKDSPLKSFAGTVLLTRNFGYPGRIDSFERVWLTFAELTQSAEVSLNKTLLGKCDEKTLPSEWDVTSLLRPRNLLEVRLVADTDEGSLWGEVALEIRRTAFLRDVKACIEHNGETTSLSVTGTVVGSCDRPLELYTLLEGKTVGYATVPLTETVNSFTMAIDEHALEEREVAPASVSDLRVELVDGGVVWYSVNAQIE